jgi:ornithine carbamoyltransferase
MLGMNLHAAVPEGYDPDKGIMEKASEIASENGSVIKIFRNPKEAVAGADVIYSDTWVSMGDEAEMEKRLGDFDGFQVNMELMNTAKPDSIFMHCLPAHRGQEVTDEVMDSSRSVVFQEAENRMHAQKALMIRLAGLR